ncbi:hypothetical protein ACNOYE_38710 [Nannocystaceae bacterium ST9]
MTRLALASLLVLGSCGPATQVDPQIAAARGGEQVRIRGDDFAGHGGVVVSFGELPGHAAVIESERTIHVITPSVPAELRGQPLTIGLRFADGTQRVLDEHIVFAAGPIEIRARE